MLILGSDVCSSIFLVLKFDNGRCRSSFDGDVVRL